MVAGGKTKEWVLTLKNFKYKIQNFDILIFCWAHLPVLTVCEWDSSVLHTEPNDRNPSSRRTATFWCKYTACNERTYIVLLQLDPENPRASALKESVVTDKQLRTARLGRAAALFGHQRLGVWRAFLPNTFVSFKHLKVSYTAGNGHRAWLK